MVRSFNLLFLIGVFCALNLSFVSSAAISGPYDQRRFLEVNPGEVKEFRMVLQNIDGDEDALFNSRVVKGEDYVSLMNGDSYLVPVGSNNVSVFVRVEIPFNINKDEIDSRIVFDPQHSIDGGTVQVAIGLSWDLKIIVLGVEGGFKENETSEWVINDDGGRDMEDLSSNSFSNMGILIWWLLILIFIMGIIFVIGLIYRNAIK